jgi:hypothetical protein
MLTQAVSRRSSQSGQSKMGQDFHLAVQWGEAGIVLCWEDKMGLDSHQAV